MSYILEALKKADAERSRGKVPGLHDRPDRHADVADPHPPTPRRWGLALGALAAVVLVALGVARSPWWGAGREATPVTVGLASAPPQPRAFPAPTASTAPPLAPALPIPPTPEMPSPTAPAAVPTPPRAPAEPQASTPAAGNLPTSARPQAPTAPARPTGNTALPRREQLPEPLRSSLPPLQVGFSLFSEVPSQRKLMLNGQVLHEGDRIGPDHQLVEIRLRSAVLDYRGTRYLIAY